MTAKNKYEIAKEIEGMRKKTGLSKNRFSHNCGISRQFYNRISQGLAYPSLSMLSAMKQRGFNIDNILQGDK